jgi:hypothetical protein
MNAALFDTKQSALATAVVNGQDSGLDPKQALAEAFARLGAGVDELRDA